MQGDFDSFLAHATRVQATALCPEVRLHLAGDLDELWRAQENWLGRRGLPPPYWGMAWPGGQAIARHLLDHRARIEGRSVLDLGSGSGLAAIAAAMMGASHVVANDIDPFACEAMAANARLAGIELETSADDLIGTTGRWDIVLAGQDAPARQPAAVRIAGARCGPGRVHLHPRRVAAAAPQPGLRRQPAADQGRGIEPARSCYRRQGGSRQCAC